MDEWVVSDQSLSLHIDVLLAGVKIAFLILEFLLKVWLERTVEVLDKNLFVKSESVLDLSDVFKVNCVRDAETLHLICVAPVLEMLLKSTAAPVTCSATNLTFVFLA